MRGGLRTIGALGREVWHVVRAALAGWVADRAPSMGAAIAYYAVFSLGPMLILIIAVAGLVYGKQAAEGALFEQIAVLVGPESAGAVQALLRGASNTSSGILATIVGAAILIFAATGVFGEIQGAFNVIWKVERPKRKGIWHALLLYLRSSSLILVTSLLLVGALAITTALAFFSNFLEQYVPALADALGYGNLATSLGVPTLLFALMYKILPDATVEWRDVWLGAITTAALFMLGRYVIGLYIGQGVVMSTYRAVGAIVLVLVWIYYAAQILLFGAELAKASGDRRRPKGGSNDKQ
ncbi:MAG TPA: YihY/virulence factor BrkB family protein [Stellaceae bacterium]|nr:YihY/virulence factor BrkB family protein [Stellaceae bacterium]